MEIVKFKEQNGVSAKGNYPIHTSNGRTTACFKLSFKELIILLIFRRVYISQENDNKSQPLSRFAISVNKCNMFNLQKNNA